MSNLTPESFRDDIQFGRGWPGPVAVFRTSEPVRFKVHGRPQQRGSKVPRLVKRRDGSSVAVAIDSNRKSTAWMQAVRDAAVEAMGERDLITGPVEVSMVFRFARPKSHHKAGNAENVLKAKAPPYHVQSPDVDKLCRGALDGMTGTVFLDDRQVWGLTATRLWTVGPEGMEVRVVESVE